MNALWSARKTGLTSNAPRTDFFSFFLSRAGLNYSGHASLPRHDGDANRSQKAAKRLLRDFNEVEQLQVSIKGPGDFVSQADLRAEQTLREELERARPGYAFLMEESGESGSDNWTWRWIVDPLDGTSNFLHGIPHWAISIGLQRRLPDGKVELAAA